MLAIALVLPVAPAHAGVSIGATRIIYGAGQKEASIEVRNRGDGPRLIQSWVEAESGAQSANFVVTPPIFRIEGDAGSLLRVMQVSPFPEDRESLSWLNVRAIPAGRPDPTKNQLQLSIQSKIKIIYRPEALLGEVPEDHAEHLEWTCDNHGLQVFNPSNYYMNFALLEWNGSALPLPGYIAPKSSRVFRGTGARKGCQVKWSLIGDHGGVGKNHSRSLP